MAFHFTLEAVLRLRQSLEDRELLLLQSLQSRRAALLSEVDELRQASFDLEQETKQSMLLRPTPAVEIHFAMARLQGLDRRRQLLREQLRRLDDAIVEQRLRFQQQRRNREVLEVLRDGQWRDYQLTQRRREQAQLDELHLLRRKQQLAICVSS
jgi:flagellar export protein FliJ